MSAIRSWINCGSNDVPAGAWCARARRVDATVDIRGRMVVKMEELNMAFYDVYIKELLWFWISRPPAFSDNLF